MLDSFGIAPRGLGADPEGTEKMLDDPMALAALDREHAPALGEEHAAIGALLDEAVLGQAFQHLGDGGLGDAEACGDIDLPRLAAIADEIAINST